MENKRKPSAPDRTQGLVRRIRWARDFVSTAAGPYSSASAEAQMSAQRSGVFLLPEPRRDGVGIQGFLRICLMQLARDTGSTYVHVPFAGVGHRDDDPEGSTMTEQGWTDAWERLFNLGEGEFPFSHLRRDQGWFQLLRQLAGVDERLFDPVDSYRHRLVDVIDSLHSSAMERKAVHVLGLGICRHPALFNLFLDRTLIEGLKSKFQRSGFQPNRKLFMPESRNVAIHIRRGDAWRAVQSGSADNQYHSRILTESYYLSLMQRLADWLAVSDQPACLHIFSDGKQEDFTALMEGTHKVALQEASRGRIQDIRLHTDVSAMDTLYHLASADVLVPGKSSFSVLAVIVGRGVVVTDPAILRFYQYAPLARYLEDNPGVVQFEGLSATDVS